MTDAIEITYVLTRDEFMRSFRAYFGRSLKFELEGIAAFALCGLCIYCIMLLGHNVYTWLLFAVGFFFAASAILIHFLLPWYAYRATPKQSLDVRIKFSAAEIAFTSADLASQVAWSYFRGWRWETDFFLLLHGRSNFVAIPRRAVGTDDIQFALLLERKLGPAENGSPEHRAAMTPIGKVLLAIAIVVAAVAIGFLVTFLHDHDHEIPTVGSDLSKASGRREPVVSSAFDRACSNDVARMKINRRARRGSYGTPLASEVEPRSSATGPWPPTTAHSPPTSLPPHSPARTGRCTAAAPGLRPGSRAS